jgi:hypothetical protein
LLLWRVGWGWMDVWCGDAMRSAGLRGFWEGLARVL